SHLPELGLPAFDTSDLHEVLAWLAPGCRSFADLRGADWMSALAGRLSYEQRQAVEREAPERLEVPGGSRVAPQDEEDPPPAPAGPGGAHPGDVRPCRHAPTGRRPGARAAAPARAQLSPAADHRRPRQLLGQHLRAGPQGIAGALPEACLARGPLSRRAGAR